MTIDDQIKDDKLQYDINRETAKISALSSGKISKYEYLTGEEIFHSNHKQIIEQTKFNYSPLGKAFQKQTKRIEDQGQKQVDPLKALEPKKLEAIKENKSGNNEKPLENKKFFDELSNERIEINFNSLNYYFKDKNISPINFSGFTVPMHIYNNIKNGNTSIEKIEEDQTQFKSNLKEIITGNPKYKSKVN